MSIKLSTSNSFDFKYMQTSSLHSALNGSCLFTHLSKNDVVQIFVKDCVNEKNGNRS